MNREELENELHECDGELACVLYVAEQHAKEKAIEVLNRIELEKRFMTSDLEAIMKQIKKELE